MTTERPVLGTQETALGDICHVPNQETLTTRQFIKLAADIAGAELTIRTLPLWVVKPLGLVSSSFKQLRDTQYQRSEPFVVNHDKFKTSFEFYPTPHQQELEQTIV